MATIRHLGTSRHDGRLHDVLLYTLPDGGAQVALHVDRISRLVSKVEQLATDPQVGDATFDVEFSGYRAVDGIEFLTGETDVEDDERVFGHAAHVASRGFAHRRRRR